MATGTSTSPGSGSEEKKETEDIDATESDTTVPILCVGDVPFSYNVPSFPAFTARVRAMKYELCLEDGENEKVIYHGLIRDCPEIKRTYPALALISPGTSNAFFVEVST